MDQNQQQESKKSGIARRGFASLSAEQRKNISSKGGHAAHEKGTAHKFSPEEARKAGRKGGEKTSQNRAYMAEIGKRGGEASRAGRSKNAQEQQETANMNDKPDESNSTATQQHVNGNKDNNENTERAAS